MIPSRQAHVCVALLGVFTHKKGTVWVMGGHCYLQFGLGVLVWKIKHACARSLWWHQLQAAQQYVCDLHTCKTHLLFFIQIHRRLQPKLQSCLFSGLLQTADCLKTKVRRAVSLLNVTWFKIQDQIYLIMGKKHS